MNKKQYNNIIENTLKNEQKSDSLETARAIFNNMGVALPNGNMREVYEVIKGNDYMGWKSCTMEEAQLAADNGVAAIGISENRIVVLSATDDEEPVAQNETVMTLSSDLTDGEVSDLSYYTYSYRSTAWGDGSGTTTHRKAIIIVPGAMGTELELAEDTADFKAKTRVWPPEDIDDEEPSDMLERVEETLKFLECNQDGSSKYELRITDNKYGAENKYQELYTRLNSRYGNDYDVIFYGYDWRKSSAVLGIFFANLIDEYESVIIVAHSMGGLVTSHLLRNTYIRSKVEKVITLGTPFLGALEMLPLMFSGKLDALESELSDYKWYEILYAQLQLEPVLKELSANIPSLYELLPTKQFFDLDNRWYYATVYGGGSYSPRTTFEQTRSCLIADAYNFNSTIFDQATNRHDLLWDGDTHITSNVDTYYIVGESKSTANKYYFYSTDPIENVNAGDGTVLSYSASMNDLYPSKTYFVNASHTGLLSNNSVMNFIERIIDEGTLYVQGIRTTPSYGL